MSLLCTVALCVDLSVFSFLQRLTAHLHSLKAPPYVINLDPAVHEVPFPANIGEDHSVSWTDRTYSQPCSTSDWWLTYSTDLVSFWSLLLSVAFSLSVFFPPDIRDTVNYKEVMKQYGLGPNGGIVTSLNLFATRFDQVTKLSL